jgi:hypothetical protein
MDGIWIPSVGKLGSDGNGIEMLIGGRERLGRLRSSPGMDGI